ncbi:TetR/AcrR family transcriptional regulator [Agromyces atrinae]|uniref:TetR/AcrR family transcriptional regulator n=1 Tax=Agromyces atrinae TaxID=592376 RepID=UPI001F58B8A8|nr:TetR/AcrR family transcriptional regulator [Agromyces atrinae]MCI2957050.1 TetR/AcrR family transcriptional regulator [Agromyces atrinae]
MTQAEAIRGRGKARGTYAKTGLKKAAILDAALAVFAKSGYRSGSIREVAENVGMSEAGLLHHFPNKSALLSAVLDLRDQRSYEFVPLDSTDPHRALRGLVALARYNATIPGVVELYCVLSAEATSPDHPAHEYFVNRYQWTHGHIASHFARIEALGELRPGVTPASAASQTVAMMDGLQVQWLLDRDSVDMSAELAAFLSTIVTFEI